MHAHDLGAGIYDAVPVLPQIDFRAIAELRIRQAGLGVERNQLVAARDIKNALVGAVGPI